MIRRNDGIWELNDNEMNALSFFAKKASLTFKKEEVLFKFIIDKAIEMSIYIYNKLDEVGFYEQFKDNFLN